ncbi:Leucine rich repeat-containing protein [Pseudobutyrivibrio xylanivorans]|uniref:Leucine rich repeat-containing protein n=2 Tax=Pseudobutyrivibrio xylanivorans TaxID=185007 RepID=A0A1G5S1D6_PSEXY|nr:Leucine rich repeat-containing protein [Pseudobutyrivibrio xylanivorans]
MYAFQECALLECVVFSNSLETICSDAFWGCTSLKTINLPDSLTRIDMSAFWNAGIQQIEFPANIKKVSGFGGLKQLEEIVIPEGVTIIDDFAFEECSALERIELPKSLREIRSYAFWGTGLREIAIPDEVSFLGECAFSLCNSLKSIIFEGADADINWYAFDGTKDFTIYVPAGGSVEEYANNHGIAFEVYPPEKNPESVHVPTNEEIQQIVEKNMWTKDPSEYTHEEVVHSLECLAMLQKEQLQDQATRDFFCETYRNNREAVKEQTAEVLKAFNISFEEVESIFKRVIFE